MVALLGPVRLALDGPERVAVQALVAGGLVAPEEAARAYAVPDLPDWLVSARSRPEEGSPLRAIG
jgi:hypothetical protein